MSDRQTAWVIESGAATYWTGRAADDFASDHNDAVRFARQEDAERVRCWLIERANKPLSKACRASEHVWIGGTKEDAPASRKAVPAWAKKGGVAR